MELHEKAQQPTLLTTAAKAAMFAAQETLLLLVCLVNGSCWHLRSGYNTESAVCVRPARMGDSRVAADFCNSSYQQRKRPEQLGA